PSATGASTSRSSGSPATATSTRSSGRSATAPRWCSRCCSSSGAPTAGTSTSASATPSRPATPRPPAAPCASTWTGCSSRSSNTRPGAATGPADAGPRPARRHPTCRRTGRPPAPRGAADVTRANPLSALRRLYTVYSWQRPPGGADGPLPGRGGSKGEPPMELTLGHWAYLVGMVVIIGTMAFRRNVVVPAVAATFAVTWAYTGNVVDCLESMFKASLVAAGELFNIFLIIALITAMLGALQRLGS